MAFTGPKLLLGGEKENADLSLPSSIAPPVPSAFPPPPPTPPPICHVCLETIFHGTMRVSVKACLHQYHVGCRESLVRFGACCKCALRLGPKAINIPHRGENPEFSSDSSSGESGGSGEEDALDMMDL